MAKYLDERYSVGSGEVILSVLIGNAQIGVSLVKLDDTEIGRGEINNLVLGSVLVGKRLFIKTVIADVSDKTNVLTVKYSLKGGKTNKDYVLSDEVAREGDSLAFRASFRFQD